MYFNTAVMVLMNDSYFKENFVCGQLIIVYKEEAVNWCISLH